jgi:hypothetical protein
MTTNFPTIVKILRRKGVGQGKNQPGRHFLTNGRDFRPDLGWSGNDVLDLNPLPSYKNLRRQAGHSIDVGR